MQSSIDGGQLLDSGEAAVAFRAGRTSLGIAYWRLWTSSGLSNLADGIVKVALPLVAIQFTRSPTSIAGLTVALTLPWGCSHCRPGGFVRTTTKTHAQEKRSIAAEPRLRSRASSCGHPPEPGFSSLRWP
jgi:hypothetical protein